jgi:hypothetical protein
MDSPEIWFCSRSNSTNTLRISSGYGVAKALLLVLVRQYVKATEFIASNFVDNVVIQQLAYSSITINQIPWAWSYMTQRHPTRSHTLSSI